MNVTEENKTTEDKTTDGNKITEGNNTIRNKCIKVSLKKILRNNGYVENLLDAIKRVNILTFHSYHLLRLYILKQYHNNETIVINENIIKQCIKSLCLKNRGPPEKESSTIFKDFYNSDYKSIGLKEPINACNLSHILDEAEKTMIVSIHNNIINHFPSYIKRYLNNYFKHLFESELSQNDKTFKDELFDKIKILYLDLLNGTTKIFDTNDNIFIDFYKENKKNIIPDNLYADSLYADLREEPIRYLKYMIYMNLELEKITKKQFQFFPIKSSFADNYITLTTSALIDLNNEEILDEKGNKITKTQMLNNVNTFEKLIWNQYFQIDNKIFNNKKTYQFNYRISTDGLGVSLLLIHKDDIEKELAIIKRKRDGKEKKKEEIKNLKIKYKDDIEKFYTNVRLLEQKILLDLPKEEIKELKNLKKNEKANALKEENKFIDNIFKQNKEEKNALEKINREEKVKETKKIKKQKNDEETKGMSKIEKARYKKHNENMKNENYYLEDLSIDEVKNIGNNFLVIDPGKKNLLTICDSNKKILKYSNGKRLSESKRTIYLKRIESYKKQHNLKEEENKINHSKSCNYNNFKEYIKIKTELFERYREEYNKFLKYKWFGYINRRRSEDKFMNSVEETFGEEKVKNIFVGDWSSKCNTQLKGTISTPLKGLNKLIKQKYGIKGLLDEYNTSKMYHYTGQKLKKTYVEYKKKNEESNLYSGYLHSVLTCETERNEEDKIINKTIYINRDRNAVLNMLQLVKHYQECKERPSHLKRGT